MKHMSVSEMLLEIKLVQLRALRGELSAVDAATTIMCLQSSIIHNLNSLSQCHAGGTTHDDVVAPGFYLDEKKAAWYD